MQIGYYAMFNYDEYDPTEEKYSISILFPDVPECCIRRNLSISFKYKKKPQDC